MRHIKTFSLQPSVGLDSARRLVSKYGFGPNEGTVSVFDDFLGDSIDARWNTAIGSDVSGTVPVVQITAGVNGVVTILSSDSNTSVAADAALLNGELNWKANQGNLVIEARFKLPNISSESFFFGLTDTKALEAPVNSAGATTITTTATDAVGILYDTTFTDDSIRLVGVANDVDATMQNTGIIPVADTYEQWRIEVSAAGAATYFRNNRKIGSTMAGAVTPTVSLTPVVYIRSLTTASRQIDLDWLYVAANRV